MKNFNLIVVFLLFAISSQAQSIRSYVITNAGASLMSNEGGMYLSIGESMSTEISNGDIMISQGFLQVSVIASNAVSTDELLNEPIKVFPNPSANNITIDIPEFEGAYQFQLFDITGSIIEQDNLMQSKQKIDLETVPPGTYLLKVIKDDKQSKTLKIVKL